MRPLLRITLIVLVAAAFLIAWGQAHSRRRKSGPSSADDAALLLEGTLNPVVTNPIDARNLVLGVPLESWVTKGQVIGEADFEPAPGQLNQARSELGAAAAAVAAEQNRIHEIDADLANARAEAGTAESQSFAAQTAKFDAERELERNSELYREGLESQDEYDAARSAFDLAESAIATSQAHASDMAGRVDELEARSSAARQALEKDVARCRRLQSAASQVEERGGRAPVVAPADGVILEEGTAGDRFGIAADPSRLSAGAVVGEAELASLRIGQPARVALAARPDVNFAATLAAIDETPVDSPVGATYRITFSLSDSGLEELAGIPVRIRLARMQP